MKHVLAHSHAHLDSETPSPQKTKSKPKAQPNAILEFVLNAESGEKKWEAGIKYWFQQNVPGHQTEECSMSGGPGAPDGYTAGWLVLELKGKQKCWIEGFFEGLARKEYSFQLLVVAAQNILLVFPGPNAQPKEWDADKTQEWNALVKETHAFKGSASAAGKKLASSHRAKSHRILKFAIFKWAPDLTGSLFPANQTKNEALQAFKHLVTSIDTNNARIEITHRNFCLILKSLLPFFDAADKKFEVVHGFFRCLSFWNPKYVPVASEEPAETDRVVLGAGHFEGLLPDARDEFISAIQRYEVRKPEKARFYAHYDKAIDAVDHLYRANHGIFFTNEYLARLAITLAEKHVGSLAEKYIVFDPACGSGNLVTSWNHHLDLRHKVVSEISHVLLKAFELRLQDKSKEKKKGVTIIPKTSTGQGLNFVNRDAASYLKIINGELKNKGHKLNKPLAIICNPPYRNQKNIKDEFYKYEVHPSLVNIAGKDATNELFVAFLSQIAEVCRLAEEADFPPNSIALLFTTTVWLTGKASYKKIKDHFLSRFQERMGFVVSSNEFFDVSKKKWPLLCTLWEYQPDADLDPTRPIAFRNLIDLKKSDLKELANDKVDAFDDLTHWGGDELFYPRLQRLLKTKEGPSIHYNASMVKLKDNIPPQNGDGNCQIGADLIERRAILGGLCFPTDKQIKERRTKFTKRVLPVYTKNREEGTKLPLPSFVVHGHPSGECIGFTEGKQPFRTKRPYLNDGKRLFFMLDTRFIKIGTSQCFSGPPPKRGHTIAALGPKEQNLIIGYAMAKSLAGNYRVQYEQFDMWLPKGSPADMLELLELAVAFLYSYNSCIECEIPKDHPTKGVGRTFVTNPLSPNSDTIWEKLLRPIVQYGSTQPAKSAVAANDKLYQTWKEWISDHPAYRAKAPLAVYSHTDNRIPLDGWGLFQIGQEVELFLKDEQVLHTVNAERKKAVNELKVQIRKTLEEKLNYWAK